MNDGASRSNDTYENWRARKISLSDLEALSEDKIRAEFKVSDYYTSQKRFKLVLNM